MVLCGEALLLFVRVFLRWTACLTEAFDDEKNATAFGAMTIPVHRLFVNAAGDNSGRAYNFLRSFLGSLAMRYWPLCIR